MRQVSNDQYEVNWSQPKKSSGHPEYKKNLENAYKFIENTKKHLLNGMSVKVVDSQSIPKALLMIAWTPPKKDPIGNYATPINLHQPTLKADKQTEVVFNAYIQRATEYEKFRPLERELEPVALLV